MKPEKEFLSGLLASRLRIPVKATDLKRSLIKYLCLHRDFSEFQICDITYKSNISIRNILKMEQISEKLDSLLLEGRILCYFKVI